ncbi:MAG TPA: VIT domain-containing protein [Tepidisphaeraceae bacterium]
MKSPDTKSVHVRIRRSFTLIIAAFTLCAVLPAFRANASGLLIADGGNGGVLTIKQQDVRVTINNGVAVTHVTQVFQNTENRQVEALYTFPVPKGASVANFSMWINGKEMVGEVVEKARARQIYDSYRQRRRDPGLLEQTDFRTFEMRVFPIAPLAEQKVEISYYQELDFDHDWATYVYPLATATRPELRQQTAGKFSLNFDVKSQIPVSAIESPSHPNDFAFAKHREDYWQASFERRDGDLGRDVVLAYHLARPKTGVDMITSRQGDEDGYFCLTLTAGQELKAKEAGMDYVFVLDISGSMNDDGKLKISRGSLDAFINALGAGDHFEVMTFNVEPHRLFNKLTDATPESKQKAVAFLTSQEARGGTVLHPALTSAYKYAQPSRPLNVVILSDGLTEADERAQLIDLIAHRPTGSRVFCIGVGNDVDRGLLNKMATDAGGLCAFLSSEDNLDRQAQAFRRKLMHPVAGDIKLDFQGAKVYDLEPQQIPNLYFGMPVRVYGRYRNSGPAKLMLTATIEGQKLSRPVDLDFPAKDVANPEIERMWAMKKVDQLLAAGDAGSSPNSVSGEIVRLGEAYSIATQYTSFIVLENDAEYQRWQIDRKNVLRLKRDRAAQETVAHELAALRDKAAADLGPAPEKAPEPAAPVLSAPMPTPSVTPTGPSPAPRQNQPAPRSHNSTDIETGGGSNGGGAFGPLSSVGVIALAVLVVISHTRARGARTTEAA